jgi:hypothetical protein
MDVSLLWPGPKREWGISARVRVARSSGPFAPKLGTFVLPFPLNQLPKNLRQRSSRSILRLLARSGQSGQSPAKVRA